MITEVEIFKYSKTLKGLHSTWKIRRGGANYFKILIKNKIPISKIGT